MQSKSWRHLVLCTCGSVALGWLGLVGGCGQSEGTPTAAAAAGQGQTAPGVESAKARQLIAKARDFYRSAERVQATITISVESDGDESVSTMHLATEQPNRVALALSEGEVREYGLYSDGQRLQQLLGGPLNIYSEQAARDNYTQTMNAAKLGHEDGGGAMMLIMAPYLLGIGLASGEVFDELVAQSDRAVYVGQKRINGALHEHVRLESDSVNFELWIADGERPWVSRIVPDLSPAMEEMKASLGESAADVLGEVPKITVSLDWSLPAVFADEVFAFTAPANAEKVESLALALRERFEQQQGPRASPHAQMLGQPAPALDLELLEGGRVSLADQKGKVVILDFWATWCGPCIHALPILTSVAKQYEDRGVVFYAVNVRENPETVRQFLDQRDLRMTVPMDVEAEVSQRYGVNGIPQTVIIGKDGTVQAVHVGLLPNLKEQLSREVEKLLEGENLVSPSGS